MRRHYEPRIGTWYVGEADTGSFRVFDCDVVSGVVHLRAADGRKLRMTFESWYRHSLVPADGADRMDHAPDRFEWQEPAIG